MDAQVDAGGNTALLSLVCNFNICGSGLARFLEWLAYAEPDRFKELAQAYTRHLASFDYEHTGKTIDH